MRDRPDAASTSAAAPSPQQLLTVARGGRYLAAGDLFNYAVRFLAALVLARVLGADGYGLYTLAVSLAFLVSGLGNLGLDAAMERYVAVLRQRGDEPGLWGTLQLGMGVTLVGALATSTALFFAADIISETLFEDGRLAPFFEVGAFVVPFLISTTLLASIARGFKRMDFSALTEDFIQPTVRIILIGILAIIGLDATVAFVIFGVSYAAAAIVLVGLVHRLHPLNRPIRGGRRYVKEIAVFSFPFWFAGMLTQVRKNVQPVLLGVYSTVVNVGIISLVTSANLLGRIAIMSIRTSLRPTLAETLDDGDLRQTLHLYQATTRWTLTANLPVFLVMVLYPAAVLSLFGESFEAGAVALTIVAFGELSNAATGTCGTLIDMSGLNLVKSVNKIFEIGFTLAVNVWFISQWGLIGAAVASLLSRAVIQMVRIVEVRVIIGLHPYNLRILKPILAAVVAFAAGKGIDLVIPASAGLGQLVLDVIIVAAVYVGTLLLMGLSDEDRMVIRVLAKRLPRSPS